MQALQDISPGDILLDVFIEESHSWELAKNLASGLIPRREPWIGFLHNPPNMPSWYYWQDSPQSIFACNSMQESLRCCKGIFVLSEHLAHWVRNNTLLPCAALKHPTEIPQVKFSPDKYFENPKPGIIQIGYWLRQLTSIQYLPTEKLEKVWLVTKPSAREFRDSVEILHQKTTAKPVGHYREINWVDHEIYDQLLSNNIAFVHYYDASASNAILDCIARNTPILVNPLPGVVEYLGEDYPFYFHNLKEAAGKAENDNLIEDTYEYLKTMDKRFLQQDTFRQAFINSDVFKGCLDVRGKEQAR